MRGADSEKSLSTVHVSPSRQIPTIESGSPTEKFSRCELFNESRIDIGFICDSAVLDLVEGLSTQVSTAASCKTRVFQGTSLGWWESPEEGCSSSRDQQCGASPKQPARYCSG